MQSRGRRLDGVGLSVLNVVKNYSCAWKDFPPSRGCHAIARRLLRLLASVLQAASYAFQPLLIASVGISAPY